MVHQLGNPSAEVFGKLDLWIAYSRNPARCAVRELILRIEAGVVVPPDDSSEPIESGEMDDTDLITAGMEMPLK